MHKYLISIITVLLMVGLFGCSKESVKEYEANTIVVHENGKIVEYIVEGFSLNQYSLEELKSKIETDIRNYNNDNSEDSVTLHDLTIVDETVKVTLEYASYLDFEKFNQITFFVGTIEAAIKGKYDLDVSLQSTNDSKDRIMKSKIMNMSNKNIIIFNKPVHVVVPRKILYCSEDAVLMSHKQIETQAGKTQYIIY